MSNSARPAAKRANRLSGSPGTGVPGSPATGLSSGRQAARIATPKTSKDARTADCQGDYQRPPRPARWAWVWAAVLAISPAVAGCSSDLLLAASDLEFAPNPARPGDSVVVSFRLTLVPKHEYVAVVLIDGREHLRVTRFEAVNGPVLFTLGDAADLIARYGAGTHRGSAEIQVTAKSAIAKAGDREFVLEAGPLPAASGPKP